MELIPIINPQFRMGQLIITKKAYGLINNADLTDGLQRHSSCDWGDLCEEDIKTNNRSFTTDKGRLFSQYNSSKKIRFWIITEGDKSVTTILLPEEY